MTRTDAEPLTAAMKSIASATWSDVVRAMRDERVSDDHAMAWADVIRIDLEKRLATLDAARAVRGGADADALTSAIAYAMARTDTPSEMETGREYAARLAPLVIESGYLAALSRQPEEPGLDRRVVALYFLGPFGRDAGWTRPDDSAWIAALAKADHFIAEYAALAPATPKDGD
jgi:hypothetical protein